MAKRTYVVAPERGNAFYVALARDIATALNGSAADTQLLTAGDFRQVATRELASSTVLLVNPLECALSGADVVARARSAAERIAVLAECADTPFYRKQFKAGVEFDAVFDVGFVPQAERHAPRTVPYRFVFNGPRHGEAFASTAVGTRRIPWAVIGHATADRARLVGELAQRLSPRGFVFLPGLDRPERTRGLSPSALDSVLRETTLYVWQSHHAYAYYESFRFREALVAGSVPCKIDPSGSADSAPGVYRSAAELAERVQSDGPERLFRNAVEFYEERGELRDHLRAVYPSHA